MVTSWNEEKLQEAHTKAIEIFKDIVPITPPAVNGYVSFLVAPDGGKEWWTHSDKGDAARDELVSWLDNQRYEDGGTSLRWVEVQFGDEGHVTKIISCDDWLREEQRNA